MSQLQQIEYTIKPPSKFGLNLKELWQYRELFYTFTLRDIKVKYKQTVLGFLWAVLQPFLMMMVFVVFFSRTLNVPTQNIPAPIFYFSGLLFWNLFSTGLNSSGNSMIANANILKKIYFPRMIIPLSGVLVSLFDMLMALMVFAGLLIYYELTVAAFVVDYSKLVLLFPAGIIVAFLSTFGLGSFIAALNVKYRDFRYIIPFLIQFLLFVTPVIYPITVFETNSWAQYVLSINPMSAAVMLGRSPFVQEQMNVDLLSIGLMSTVIIVILGIYYFKKTEYYFADLA